jgi:hypothetical protein
VKKIFIYIILVVISASCAHELPLTGGEKDTKPPVAEKFDPPNQSTRFIAKKITIEFDEYVKLKDASKQILMSPPGTTFEVVEKGKSIQLTITSTLRDNTTYVINFGSAVVDNNEGNPLNNLIYTFTTGDILDSLQTRFVVLDANTLKPVGGVQVMLYDQDVDSLPLTSLPYYAGTTDPQGRITIGYMKPGSFKVFALQEENKNYLYDKSNEGIGFLSGTISPGDTIPTKIVFFQQPATNPKVQTAKMPVAGMIHFKFTGNVEKEQLKFISTNYSYDTSKFEFIGGRKDTANYWFKPTLKDDTIRMTFTRKLGQIDTLRLYPKTMNIYTNNIVTGAPPVKLVNTPPADFDFYKKLELEFTTAIDSIHSDAIIIKEEDKRIPAKLIPLDGSNRRFVLDYPFKQSKNYTVYFPKKSMKGILGNTIDSTHFAFKTSNDKTYKTVTLNVKNPEYTGGGAIFQLLNDKDLLLDEKKIAWSDSNVVEFRNLRQGAYRIRLIYDSNNNGKWDPGNYEEKRQPEKVVYFPQNIDIKPTFDYFLEWDIMKKD